MSRIARILFLMGVLIVSGVLSCSNVAGGGKKLSEISLQNGKKLVEANDSDLSKQEKQRIQQIAEKLAVRYVNNRNPDQVKIPEEIISFFYNGLIHLKKSTIPEAKKVTDEYVLIAKTPANPREVLLWADKSASWLDAWRNGETKTGVSEIDQLIEEFGLTLSEYREFTTTSPGAFASMEADHAINVYAVGDAFMSLEEIKKAGPDGLLTGGRDVKAKIKDNYLVLDITVGSGDCPAGCINKINQKFRIFSDGQVELVD
ncbi:hypothetical protein G3569_02645 [Aliifodinibius halophilus]|uniref:Lipoprotein n=2 Tax=Fodinibius halophilus TaxID=1736908 RepID=A0A6M1TF49_9BACT|nr:hypothetical protein [Fodinibius halophilus]